MISSNFDPSAWMTVSEFPFEDITLHRARETGAVRIAFNRPECRNAFRPQTVDELLTALEWAHQQNDIGVILLTGNGPSPKDGGHAFCSGGDQRVRGKQGYEYSSSKFSRAGHGRLHILEVQRMIRFMPKVVIAVVNGWPLKNTLSSSKLTLTWPHLILALVRLTSHGKWVKNVLAKSFS